MYTGALLGWGAAAPAEAPDAACPLCGDPAQGEHRCSAAERVAEGDSAARQATAVGSLHFVGEDYARCLPPPAATELPEGFDRPAALRAVRCIVGILRANPLQRQLVRGELFRPGGAAPERRPQAGNLRQYTLLALGAEEDAGPFADCTLELLAIYLLGAASECAEDTHAAAAASPPRWHDANPYAILGVAHDASLEEIRAAHRSICRRWHPDRHRGSGEAAAAAAERRQVAAQRAYDELTEPRHGTPELAEATRKALHGDGIGADQAVDEHLRCPICSNPAFGGCVTPCCGRVFHEHCLRSALTAAAVTRGRRLCPACGAEMAGETSRAQPAVVRRMLEQVAVRCPQDCGDSVPWGALREHVLGACPRTRFGCAHEGCTVPPAERAAMLAHQCRCPHGVVPCACGARLPRGALLEHRAAQCPAEPLLCPQCRAPVPRCQLEVHLALSCPAAVPPPLAAELGCAFQCGAAQLLDAALRHPTDGAAPFLGGAPPSARLCWAVELYALFVAHSRAAAAAVRSRRRGAELLPIAWAIVGRRSRRGEGFRARAAGVGLKLHSCQIVNELGAVMEADDHAGLSLVRGLGAVTLVSASPAARQLPVTSRAAKELLALTEQCPHMHSTLLQTVLLVSELPEGRDRLSEAGLLELLLTVVMPRHDGRHHRCVAYLAVLLNVWLCGDPGGLAAFRDGGGVEWVLAHLEAALQRAAQQPPMQPGVDSTVVLHALPLLRRLVATLPQPWPLPAGALPLLLAAVVATDPRDSALARAAHAAGLDCISACLGQPAPTAHPAADALLAAPELGALLDLLADPALPAAALQRVLRVTAQLAAAGAPAAVADALAARAGARLGALLPRLLPPHGTTPAPRLLAAAALRRFGSPGRDGLSGAQFAELLAVLRSASAVREADGGEGLSEAELRAQWAAMAAAGLLTPDGLAGAAFLAERVFGAAAAAGGCGEGLDRLGDALGMDGPEAAELRRASAAASETASGATVAHALRALAAVSAVAAAENPILSARLHAQLPRELLRDLASRPGDEPAMLAACILRDLGR
eukprot:TRINITY_DN15040_c0_g1_i1.p1 TRINITY_DN15040_c0_g1~~TRINITY_DN15040_c0_g1_i1.p1  ORF type:complete len:1068 (+),score=340.47 TRINITY_DN15040_c0_g1_i1:64-3204(+)